MRLIRLTPLALAAMILTSCTSGPLESAGPKEIGSAAEKPTVESLIALGCDKYLGLDSKSAQAHFEALAKLDSSYNDVKNATKDLITTLKGVRTVQAIEELDAKSKQRVYESVLTIESLCVGVDAP